MDNTEINPLEILYQDEYLVAINKPSGLLVHKSPIDKHETQFALQLVRDQIGQYVYPIHRLDKPTSGVLLFALSAQMAQTMSLLFRSSEVHKEYIAIVRGFTEDASLIIFYIFNQHFIQFISRETAEFSEMKAAMDRQIKFIVSAICC